MDINDLGPRYSPELNVQLEINEKFEYLRRSSKVYLSIQRIRKAFIKTGRNYVNEIVKANIYEQQGREKTAKNYRKCVRTAKNEYKEMQLLTFECISDELKKIKDINHEISNVVFSRMSHDFYNSKFYKAYSEFENTIYEIEELIKGDYFISSVNPKEQIKQLF